MGGTGFPAPGGGSDERQLLILGTTDFSAQVAASAADAGFDVAGFVENLSPERCRSTHVDLPVYWIDEVERLAARHVAVCGLGTTRRSTFVEQAVARGLRFTTVVHPTASVSATSTLGEGSYVGPRAVVAAHARVGRHVIVLAGSLIGHHTEIGDFASILMGANVAGSCRIGEAAYVATGAVVIDHVSVGSGSVVGAGAVVVADVPDRVQVLGVPARIVKEGIDPR